MTPAPESSPLPPPPLPVRPAPAPPAPPFAGSAPADALDEEMSSDAAGGHGRSRGALVAFGVMVLAALAVVGWQVRPRSAKAAGWIDGFDAGVQASQASGKPLVLLFTADWCPACVQFERGTLSDPAVASHLRQNFTPVVIDLSDRADQASGRVAQDYRVQSIPSVVLHDAKGFEVARAHGMDAGAFVAWLGTTRGGGR